MDLRPRRWLTTLLVALGACGIDARGELGSTATGSPADGGGPLGPTDDARPPPIDDAATTTDGAATTDGGVPSRGRVTDGLILLYELEENSGTTAKDTSGVAPALDLGVPSSVTWIPKALRFDAAAHAKTNGPATKVVQRCGASNAITLEAWFRYVNLPDWSRIIALSASADTGNVAMTSNPITVGFDLRSTDDPYLRTTRDLHDGGTPTALVHLVETRAANGAKRVYFDGVLVIDSVQGGDFSTWDPSYPLSIGNTPALDRPFYGEVHMIAIYDRALTAAEVATNRAAGANP